MLDYTRKPLGGGLNFWLHLGCPDEDTSVYQDAVTKQVVREVPPNTSLEDRCNKYFPRRFLDLWIHNSTTFEVKLEVLARAA